MSDLLIPELTSVNVLNLPDAFRGIWRVLVLQWSRKLERNILRMRYYDGRNRLKDLGIAIPPSLRHVETVVGWPQKSVDVLADRITFDGFGSSSDSSNDPYGLEDVLEANDFRLELSQAVRSALIHSCSFLTVRSREPDEDGLPPVVVSFRSATFATGIWDYSRRRLSSALTVTGVDSDALAQTGQVIPSELMLYVPGWTVHVRRQDNGSYVADDPRATNLDHVPVYLLSYHPDLERPFGRARISREVMSLTDAAVRTMLRMDISAEFYSWPQRVMLGADEPPVSKDGKTLTGWEASMSKFLVVTPNENGDIPSVQQFSQMTMQPLSDLLRSLAGRMSGATGIPMNQLGITTDNGQANGADAIHASEDPLVIDAENAAMSFGSSLRRAAQDMVMLSDGGDASGIRVNWRNPERPSMSTVSAAIMQQVQAIPWLADTRVVLERLGYRQAEIESLESDKRRSEASATLDKLLKVGGSGDESGERGQAVEGADDGERSGGQGAADPVRQGPKPAQ